MNIYAAVVNTYSRVGKEFVDFASVVDSKNRGKARGRDLTNLLSLLGVYANAEKVVLTHAPALKRAQRGDVVAAIAAKDAQAAATAAKEANTKAAHLRDNATQKKHPKASICPELRGDISLMGRSSSIARDAKGTTPARDGHIIAESTTQQFNTEPPTIPK